MKDETLNDESLTETQRDACATMFRLCKKLHDLDSMTKASAPAKVPESIKSDILSDLYHLRSFSDKKDEVVPIQVFAAMSPEIRMISLDSMLGVLAAIVQNGL